MKKKTNETNTYGFTLVELMVACVLSSVILLGLTNFFVDSLKLQKLQELQLDLNELKNQVFVFLSHPVAFNFIKNQPSFSCVGTSPALPTCVGAQRIIIHDSQGVPFVDGINPNIGFTVNGQRCLSYPSPDCNIKLVVDFVEHCFSCDPRQVLIRGRFEMADDSLYGKELNLGRFDFNVIKNL